MAAARTDAAAEDKMFCPSRILVPIDLASGATPAVACAHELARAFGSRLHLLHVVADPANQGWAAMIPTADLERQADEWRQDAIEELATFAAASGCGGPGSQAGHRTTLAIRSSAEPATAILAYASEHDCDLIVMGTHRPGGLTAILRGSTAERVRRHATCPVLMVPPTVPVPVRQRWLSTDVEVGIAS
jgi:nucleotide-binding universal stress UspA family protein